MLIDDGNRISELNFICQDERSLLCQFWSEVREYDLFVGRNSLEFDISLVRQRSWIAGVKFAGDRDLRRLFSHEFVDVLHLWSRWEGSPRPSLDGLADVLGKGRKMGRGVKIKQWWEAGEFERITEHSREDNRATFEGFLRLTCQTIPDRYFESPLIAEERQNTEIVVHSRD